MFLFRWIQIFNVVSVDLLSELLTNIDYIFSAKGSYICFKPLNVFDMS